jgi:steroid delta-isomerase-like uncharacterized protein
MAFPPAQRPDAGLISGLVIRIFSEGGTLMSDANKRVVRRLIDELWNQGNPSAAEELFTPNYTHHDPSTSDFGRGPESEVKRMNLYRGAFPDLRITIENIISESDTVMARWSCHATHKGELNGIAPTGKTIDLTGISVVRLSGGKVAEGWVQWDTLGMLQQLGVVPKQVRAKAAGS